MGMVKLADLEPRMMLAADVRNHDGRFLFASGTVLTPEHIRILKVWGIVEADIQGIAADESAGLSDGGIAEVISSARGRVVHKFQRTEAGHPAVEELKKLYIERRVRNGAPHTQERSLYREQKLLRQCGCVVTGEREPELLDLAAFIQNDLRLPTLPAIFNRINETIMDPKSSANDIASVISMDVALASRLLTIVNSAFYGFPYKIDTLSRAVAIVGTKQLTTLAFGVSIMKMFEHIPLEYIDMESFWKHSIGCGLASRLIAGYKNIQNTERLFVAGLLHDIGRLILYSYWPCHMMKTLKRARDTELFVYEAEREELGTDHGEIGGLLVKKWNLPFLLENIIRYHHKPQKSQNRLESSIVHLADIITNTIEVGASGETLVPVLDSESWASLGLSKNILHPVIEHIDRQLDEIIAFFLSDPK